MNKDFNPKEISNVACACGCDTLMTMGWLHGGPGGSQRKYLYGHSPRTSVPTGASGVRKNVKSNMGPEQIDAYFAAQIAQLTANSEKLKDEAKELLAKAKARMEMANKIDEQLRQIKTVREQTGSALGRVFSRT